MQLKRTIAALGLAVASTASHAGVLYQWVSVKNDMPMRDPFIQIEIEESVVRSGSFQLNLPMGTQTIPNTGLHRFRYLDTYAPDAWFPTQYGYLNINLHFVENNFYAIGSISYMDFSSQLSTSTASAGADALLWTIHMTKGDSILGCDFYTTEKYCSGATGYFRQVPEPASITLLGAGALAVLATRRRKRHASDATTAG